MKDEAEHFIKAYSTGDTPWDSGVPDVELLRVINAGLLPGRTLLEFGCGTGTNAIELTRLGYQVLSCVSVSFCSPSGGTTTDLII